MDMSMDTHMDTSIDIHMDMSMDIHMEMPIKSKVSKSDNSAASPAHAVTLSGCPFRPFPGLSLVLKQPHAFSYALIWICPWIPTWTRP